MTHAIENQMFGTNQGQEFQHISHQDKDAPKNQIISNAKIIIPRGIINFKKGHSVSIER
jgi:hypothetical protein